MCAVTFLLLSVTWKTHGFGSAENYSLNQGDALTYEYSMSADPNDLSKPFDTDFAYVYFTLTIPVNEMDNRQEIISVLEAYRKEQIETYYAKSGEIGQGALSVFNTEKRAGEISFNRWIYRPLNGIREEDLRKIARDCDVMVRFVKEENGEFFEQEAGLEDFLKQRNF